MSNNRKAKVARTQRRFRPLVELLEAREVLSNTPNQLYVIQVYKDLLLRAVDPVGLSYWSGRLDHGDPRGIIAQSLSHSAEYYQTNVIKPSYQQFLNRQADQDGLNFWTVQLQGGLTDEQMQAGFIASDEFYRIANGSSAPVQVTPEHDRLWVDGLYQSLLGRAPDQTGEDYWTAQLQGVQTRIQVANGFTGSTEGLGLRVLQTYERYLHRGAAQSEIDYWVAQYHQGGTNEDIVTGFIGSQEYYDRAQVPVITIATPQPNSLAVTNVDVTGKVTDIGSAIVTFEVQVDTGVFAPVSFGADGSFSYTTGFSLDGSADGTHAARFRAKDAYGNITTSDDLTLHLDSIRPIVTVSSPPSGVKTNTNLGFQGTVSDAGSGVSLLEQSLDAGAFGTVSLAGDGTFSFVTNLALTGVSDGPHALRLRATDQAGNQSAVVSTTFTLDTRGPTFSIQSPTSGQVVNSNVSVAGNLADAFSAVAGLQAQVDAGAFFTLTVDGSGHFSFDTSLVLDGSADGNHTVNLRASDALGNVSSSAVSFTLRTQGGSGGTVALSIAAPVAGGKHSGAARLIGSAGLGATSGSFTLDGGASVPLVLDVAGGFDQPIGAAALPLGNHKIVVTATDNASHTATQTISFDVTADFAGGSVGTAGWGYMVGGTVHLEERDSFLIQASAPVQLGGSPGSRILSFSVDPTWDKNDGTTVSCDRLLVYLVDPTTKSTLLSSGAAGTPLLAIADSGASADFLPGLVHFNGRLAQFDVTSLADKTSGLLVFELINGDGDMGSSVQITGLADTFDPAGSAGPIFKRTAVTYVSAGGATNLAALQPSSQGTVLVNNVALQADKGLYTADIQIRNDGPALGRDLTVVFPGLPAGVQLQQASGKDASGNPYLNMRPAVHAGGLTSGSYSDVVKVTFSDPNLLRFALTPTFLVGALNRAPSLSSIAPITEAVGGYLEIPLHATDPDGDPVSYGIRGNGPFPSGTLKADGTLVLEPQPGEQGGYSFTVVASDGVLDSAQFVVITVSGTQKSTTDVAGIIEDDTGTALAGVQVELGNQTTTTAVDGTYKFTFTGDVPDGHLVVRGSGIAGSKLYSDSTEPLFALSDRPIYTGYSNVLSRPFYLTGFDPADEITVNPAQDTTITSSSAAGAALVIKAGTLFDSLGNPYTGKLGITVLSPNRTPGELPAENHPDVVYAIHAPSGLHLTSSATLKAPNRPDYQPGAKPHLLSPPIPGPDEPDSSDATLSPDNSTIQGEVPEINTYFYFVPKYGLLQIKPAAKDSFY
jgi:hypothetical protein